MYTQKAQKTKFWVFQAQKAPKVGYKMVFWKFFHQESQSPEHFYGTSVP